MLIPAALYVVMILWLVTLLGVIERETFRKGNIIMIKNRTAQLIYQTIYVTLGFVGCVASLGIFDNINMIRWDFYVHFTNLSNFLCNGRLTYMIILN